MLRMKRVIQHIGNPLHVFCRLRDFGLTETVALKMSMIYERYLYSKVLS